MVTFTFLNPQTDKSAVWDKTRTFALHGVATFALASSLSVTQPQEQQSRRGKCHYRSPTPLGQVRVSL